MVENDYPVPSYLSDVFSKPDGWIETPEADPDSKPGYQSVYAIDCEMVRALRCIRSIVLTKSKCLQCITADGKALTRVCVIDYATNKVAYDQFVKPPSPITDYLTRYVSQLITMCAPFFAL
jgi:RNA exonuclease 1